MRFLVSTFEVPNKKGKMVTTSTNPEETEKKPVIDLSNGEKLEIALFPD
jgi:hypothetical protein